MTTAAKVGRFIALAGGFGVAAALLKGLDAGLRSELGNLSAPWLLVAFLPGLRSRSIAYGALTGLAATLIALVGFYLTMTWLGHLGNHGFTGDLRLEFMGNTRYFLAGLVTGPMFGALGAWCGRRPPVYAWLVAGCMLVLEPLLVAVVANRVLPAPLYGWGVDEWAGYLSELVLGLVILAAALLFHRRIAPREG